MQKLASVQKKTKKSSESKKIKEVSEVAVVDVANQVKEKDTPEDVSFGMSLIKKLGGNKFLRGLIKNPPTHQADAKEKDIEKDLVKKIRVFKHNDEGFQCKIPSNKGKSNALQVRKKEIDGIFEVNFFVAIDTPENFSSTLEKSYDVSLDQIPACINYHTGFCFEL